jgi:cold shock CspA family protein
MGAKEPPRLEGYTQRDEETAPDVFEVSGSVKWFDPSKGYGFIAPDEDFPDVLLHVTCLRRGGFRTALEGARESPSIRVAAAHPCGRRPRERLGNSGGEVVQPITRVWLSNPRSRDTRYFCAYGNTPALRFH